LISRFFGQSITESGTCALHSVAAKAYKPKIQQHNYRINVKIGSVGPKMRSNFSFI
jgi:hypothetical protein